MFNEKQSEYYSGKYLPVSKNPKYEQSKEKALEIIKAHDGLLNEADFWILMNTNKAKDKMIYSGLIISHNGCLKLNDTLPDEMKFNPSSVSVNEAGYNNSLVYSYSNDAQGIYEVGEYSPANSKQNYPYAMAFKRLYDRVILKATKLAYSGIYSEVEADEFKQPENTPESEPVEMFNPDELASDAERKAFQDLCAMQKIDPQEVLTKVGWKGEKLTKALHGKACEYIANLQRG